MTDVEIGNMMQQQLAWTWALLLTMLGSFTLAAEEASPDAPQVSIRHEGSRWTVANRWYEVVHDAERGGSIVEVAYAESGQRLPVQMRDGMSAGGDAFALASDDQPEVVVHDRDGKAVNQGHSLVLETRAVYRHRRTPRDRCPRVTYRYTYSADSPLVRIETLMPEQTAAQRFSRVEQFIFEFSAGKPFDRVHRVVPSGTGKLMVTKFDWSPCEARPVAGALLANDADAFAAISPITGRYAIDNEGMHVTRRGFLDAWMGRRLATRAALFIGPAESAADYLAQAETPMPAPTEELTATARRLLAESHRGESPCVVETASFLGLANGQTGLLFGSDSDVVSLEGVYRRDHALLWPATADRPLWRAWLRDTTTGGWVHTSSLQADRVERAIERPDDKTVRLTLDWPSVQAGPGRVRARMTVTMRAGDPLSRWRMSIEPLDERLSMWELVFPIVAGVGPDRRVAETDFLVFPYKSGSRLPNPGAAGLWELLYPGAAGWQFMAHWQGTHGLYVGAHDGGASVKRLRSLPMGDGTVELAMIHPVPDMGLPGTGYDMPFDIVVGTFDGDWYDAAQIYRDWLTQQAWFPRRPLHANDNVPDWLKNVVVATRRSGLGNLHHSIELHDSGFQEHHLGVLEEYELLGRPPTLFWWYHAWHKREGIVNKFADSPDFHAPPGFAEKVREAKQHPNLHVISYSLSSWWDYDAPSWKDENAESAVIVNDDGRPFLYGRRNVGIMCPATKLYQQKMQRVMLRLLDQGPVDGTYFDLGGTSGASHCHATTHGHPVGSGSFPTIGKRQLMGGMRQAARERKDDFIVVMEGNADCYLDAVDGYALFEENVPVRQTLYADYCRTAGAKRTTWERSPLEAINPAKHFAWGGLIGRFVSSELITRGKPNPRAVDYFRRLVDHKRVAQPWLNLGRMLRPVNVTDLEPPDPAEFVEGTMIPSGSWQAPDGSVAFAFANARHSTSVSFRYNIDPAAYGIATDGTMELCKLTPTGDPPTPQFETLITIRGPIERHETLAPGDVLLLVAKSEE